MQWFYRIKTLSNFIQFLKCIHLQNIKFDLTFVDVMWCVLPYSALWWLKPCHVVGKSHVKYKTEEYVLKDSDYPELKIHAAL